MERLDWRDFGARGDGVFDCTAAINACFEAAIQTGLEAHGPAGTYKTTDSLIWNDAFPRISGEGRKTFIAPDDADYDWLVCGAGWNTGSDGPAGWIRDLVLRRLGDTPPEAPSGVTAGVRLNGASFTELRNVWVDFAPIGFDLINNSYGTSFYNCRTSFGRCRIGIRLSGDRPNPVPPFDPPTRFASGSDLPFFNCWFAGRDAAVWMDRSGGGYNFYGGQLLSGGGLNSEDDTLGTVTINKDLETGVATGRMSARFFGTSFESASYMWNVRVHDIAQDPNGCQLLFAGCSFTGGVDPTGNALGIGVLKLTDGYNDTIEWHNCALNGKYTNALPLSINIHPTTGRAQFVEFGTQNFATFAGGSIPDINTYNMLAVSNVNRGFGSTSFHLLMPGGMLRFNGTTLEQSTDLAPPSWSPV